MRKHFINIKKIIHKTGKNDNPNEFNTLKNKWSTPLKVEQYLLNNHNNSKNNLNL